MKFPEKDDITKILVENIVGPEKQIKDLNDSWFIKHLIIALRECIWLTVNIYIKIWNGLTVVNADGSDLDDKGYDFGIDRKQAVKAVHTVTIGKSKAVQYDTYVPDNFLVTTTASGNNPPLKFRVMKNQNKFIKAGEKEVSNVFVECEEYGSIGNVPSGYINLIAQAGFDTCTNSKISKTGTDTEDDELYRQRILERKRKPSRAGTKDDWERWAKEVPGVSGAIAYPLERGNGTVDIIIFGKEFDFPESGLVEQTQKYLDDNYVPADLWSEGIKVFEPTPKRIDFVIDKCIFKNGYDKNNSLPIIEKTLKDVLKSDYKAEVIRLKDIIVALKLAYDDKDEAQSPILYDFDIVMPEDNIILKSKEKACLGNLIVS